MKLVVVAAFAGLAVAGVLAQPNAHRKPGLWEVQSKSSGGGMPNMQEMMANVPPDQRAQVEAMMRQRGGMPGAANSFKYCLTPERAAQDTVPVSDPDTKCEHKGVSRQGNATRFAFSCKGKDGSTVDGDGRSFDVTPESYSVELNMKMVREGQPMQMRMEQKGKWLGADCKGAKPL